MDELLNGRVRLWLKSEQALGLSSLPVPPQQPDQPQPSPQAQAISSAPRRNPDPQPRTSAPPAQSPPSPRPVSTIELFMAPEQAPFDSPPLPRGEKIRLLAELNRSEVAPCRKCRLYEQRRHTVFGEGNVDAEIFFIGEGPGETEDRTGRPFVGRAGQKLDEMITAMGLRRDQVYIGNIVKCRPPDNREPVPDEVDACSGYLIRQLEIVRPKVIVTLGLPATRFLLKVKQSMGQLRGRWHEWRGIKVMPTFHPAYVLRYYTVETRRAVWSDIQKVMAELNLTPPSRGGRAYNTDSG